MVNHLHVLNFFSLCKLSDVSDDSKDYTGVIAGSAIALSLVVLIVGAVIIVMM